MAKIYVFKSKTTDSFKHLDIFLYQFPSFIKSNYLFGSTLLKYFSFPISQKSVTHRMNSAGLRSEPRETLDTYTQILIAIAKKSYV